MSMKHILLYAVVFAVGYAAAMYGPKLPMLGGGG